MPSSPVAIEVDCTIEISQEVIMNVPTTEVEQTARQTWSTYFKFGDVLDEFWDKFLFRNTIAQEIFLHLSKGKRTAFQLETGGGKTIVAFLATAPIEGRILFLAPTVVLTTQHAKFLHHEMGYKFSSRVITGDTPAQEREWGVASEHYVFATPEVIASEIIKGAKVLEQFALVVFDEVHHARGNYVYVELAQQLRALAVPYLGMSASLGGSEAGVRKLIGVMDFEEVGWYSIATPTRHEQYVFIKLSKEQVRTEEEGFKQLEQILKRKLISALLTLRVKLPTVRSEPLRALELDKITHLVNSSTKGREKSIAIMHLAVYKKFLYAYRIFIAEGYTTFLSYIEAMIERGEKSDRHLLSYTLFRRIVATAQCYRDKHPKEVRFIHEIEWAVHCKKRIVAFFANMGTARMLSDLLVSRGFRASYIFGRSGMKRKRQLEVLNEFRSGKLDVLLATSVVEEGISIPEVDLVINVHTPNETKARRQRAGRTARMKTGVVMHLIMDHPFDLQTFYVIHKKLRALETLEKKLMDHEYQLQPQLLFEF